MCGRYVQIRARKEYERYVRTLRPARKTAEERPRWNIAPSTTSWVISAEADGFAVDRLTWGIEGTHGLLSNARLETAADKPAFRDAWAASRVLVPVEGWYEWQSGLDQKQPFYFTPPEGEPVLLAALRKGDRFTLLTGGTRGALRTVHTRRPAALPLSRAEEWCDFKSVWTPEKLEAALVAEGVYLQIPVGSEVNSTRNDGPQLIEHRKPQLKQAALSFD